MWWSGGHWPNRQILHDLRGVALATRAAVTDEIARALPDIEAPLATEADYLPLIDALMETARGPDPDAAAFALAAMSADALHGQIGADAPDFGWAACQPIIAGLAPARRSAIVRGIVAAASAQSRELADPPPRDWYLSETSEAVMPPLIAVARSLDADGIRSVAMADYGYRHAEHEAALRAVLADALCRFPEGERWFPAEVVELTGHVPENGATFLPAIALLILDDIHQSGDFDQMTYRWMCNADLFLEAPEAVLRGIRHVMERSFEDGWDPYFDWNLKKIRAAARFLPWYDTGDGGGHGA